VLGSLLGSLVGSLLGSLLGALKEFSCSVTCSFCPPANRTTAPLTHSPASLQDFGIRSPFARHRTLLRDRRPAAVVAIQSSRPHAPRSRHTARCYPPEECNKHAPGSASGQCFRFPARRRDAVDRAADLRHIVPHGDLDGSRGASRAHHQRLILQVNLARTNRSGIAARRINMNPVFSGDAPSRTIDSSERPTGGRSIMLCPVPNSSTGSRLTFK